MAAQDIPKSLQLLQQKSGQRLRVLLAECTDRGYTPAETYAYLLSQKVPGMTKVAAKLLAGYSPNTTTNSIDASKVTIATTASIEEQRRKLQSTAGLTLADNIKVAKEIRDDKKEDGKVRIAAVKVIGEFLAHTAPKEINVSHTQEITSAVKTLRSLGISPMDARQTVVAVNAEYTIIEDSPERAVVNQ